LITIALSAADYTHQKIVSEPVVAPLKACALWSVNSDGKLSHRRIEAATCFAAAVNVSPWLRVRRGDIPGSWPVIRYAVRDEPGGIAHTNAILRYPVTVRGRGQASLVVALEHFK
jgi:hypothetical protein